MAENGLMGSETLLPANELLAADPGVLMTVNGHDFHLGYSRIASYLQCPKMFRYTYIDKVEYKSGTAARKGTAYHNTLETILRYKIDEGQLLDWARTEKVATRESKDQKLTPSDTKKVIQAAKFYFDNQYAVHDPIAIEEMFEIERGGVKLTGRIDLIERSGKITDHKFSHDLWPEERAKGGVQPMIYQWAGIDAIEPKFGVEYTGFAYNIIRVWPTEIIQTIDIPKVGQHESDWWEEQVAAIANAVRAGNFYATPSEKTCKWCSHAKLCQPAKYSVWFTQTNGMATEDLGY